IFVTGPQSRRETLTESDCRYIKSVTSGASGTTPTPVLIHGAYIDNPWSRSPGSTINIKREMEIATYIGAEGVVVHLGAGAYKDETLRAVLEDISTVGAHARE